MSDRLKLFIFSYIVISGFTFESCSHNEIAPSVPSGVTQIRGTIADWNGTDTMTVELLAFKAFPYGTTGYSWVACQAVVVPIASNGTFTLPLPVLQDTVLVPDIGWDQTSGTGSGTRTCVLFSFCLASKRDPTYFYGNIVEHTSSFFDSTKPGDTFCNYVYSDRPGTRFDTVVNYRPPEYSMELSISQGWFLSDTTETQTGLSYEAGWNRVRSSVVSYDKVHAVVARQVENHFDNTVWQYYPTNGPHHWRP